MRKKMAAVLMVVTMCFAAGNAAAKMGGDKGMMACSKCQDGKDKGMQMKGEGMAGRFMKMVEMLELNGEQKKAVEALHFAHHKEVIRKEADIDVAEVELQEILATEPVNLAEAEKQIRAISALRADLEIMHLQTKEAVKAKLTPAQVEKMKKHMAAGMEEQMEDMGGMGMGMEGCKMGGKAKKCDMMKDESGEAAHKSKVAEKKADHSHHH